MTRETGPRVVRGDPAKKADTPKVTSHHVHHHVTPTISVSDSSLKFTHVLYNLSPAGIFNDLLFLVGHKRLDLLFVYLVKHYVNITEL